MSDQYSVLGKAPQAGDLKKLSSSNVHLTISNLSAGYGKMEILHNLDLYVSRAQSLCLIGPNGAGKSTILHSIYGFTNIFKGKIEIDGKDITNQSPAEKLKNYGIAYILQDNSVFPDMTVEENLLMGGYIKDKTDKPSVQLVDEPSIGLEPRYIEMVFEILRDLQQNEKKTIILVEQNAKKGLEFADIGYVLVSGETAIAGKGNDLLNNPDVGRLFLGG